MENPAPTKFTWKIDNFSKLTEKKLYSDIFIGQGCKWRLNIFPKGNNVDHLSIYLDVADSVSLPNGWSRDADFILSVINQFKKKSTVTKDTQHVFNAKESDWGFTSFIPLSEINSPAAGFLVNDTLRVEVEIEVRSVVHYSVIEPAKEVNQDEPKLPKRAVETPPDQVPLPQKKVHKAAVEPPTDMVTLKPLNQTDGAVQTGASSNEQEIVKESLPPPTIVDEKDPLQDPPFEHVLSSPDVQETSKNLLNEISSRTRIQELFPSNEMTVSIEATRPDFVRQQKEALLGFFSMSLEAIQQANAFDNIEGIILALIQQADSLQEKTVLEDLASYLTEFRESIPSSTIKAETVEACRISLAGKTVDLNGILDQRQKDITTLEDTFSRLSEEQAKLQAEIQCLEIQKESARIELQKANEGASRDLEEWRDLEGEIKQSNRERLQAIEKLALANVRWKHFKEDLAETMKNVEA
ncbi:ubiquitin C-terminal hydrolase 12-like [Mercurialis annua]|uniref:ubiquitin C-terminal hydrolase 12-like n=1 Tax=Mercurialis annua TaxID=3986 RepID=UPI00215FB33A|nr:ubiquitin C-terminal hydrolase 12-like [Mercurialis annua]